MSEVIDTAPKLIVCEGGSPEWHQARCGATTASLFSTAVEVMQKDSPKKDAEGKPVRVKGDLTAANEELAAATAFELISEEPYDEGMFDNFYMKRGREEEWKARAAYVQRYDVEVYEGGVLLTYDRQFGYSTDGAVEGQKGGVEIKTPYNCSKIMDMLNSGSTAEYDHQIQGGMWIAGWEWVDFIMWMPQLRKVGNELYVKRIYRNDKFIDEMVKGLLQHRARVLELVDFFKIPHAERPGMILPPSFTDVVSRPVAAPAPATQAEAVEDIKVLDIPEPIPGLANLF
jgi:exodeoxyribonuclease (lambda-induced)